MSDSSPTISDRAGELFAESFHRLFIDDLKGRIPDFTRRRQVERAIGEISDAAAQGLARFLKGEPPEGAQTDSLFATVEKALASLTPAELWPPEGSAEACAQKIGAPFRPPDWQQEQAALFGVALELAVSALWQTGGVLHAWEQVKFASEYEPPRNLIRQLRSWGDRQGTRAVLVPTHSDESFELRYRDYLLQRWSRLDIGTLRAVSAVSVNLTDLFVMPQVSRTEMPTRKADEAVFENSSRITVLIGPPGSGKSTFLLWLQQQVAGCERELILGDEQALPVLIRVRELHDILPFQTPGGSRLVELATGSRDFAALMPDGWIDRQFAAGRVLLLLDGLDEADPSIRDRILFPWLGRMLKDHEGWRAVATSRPAGFPASAFESQIRTPFWDSGDGPFEVTFSPWQPALFTLEEFGPEEVTAYLLNWCTQVRIAGNEPAAEAAVRGQEDAEQIAAAVDAHPAVRDLARTPLLLSAICLVYRYEGGRLPDDRGALYRLCVEGLLDRWDAQKGLRSPFTAEVKLRVCRELATAMMKARSAACSYAYARKVAVAVLGNAAEAESLLGHVLNRAGLLIERQVGVLSFAHLTFQEYLTALAVRDENEQGVTIRFLAEQHFDSWWDEVVLLYCRLAPPALSCQLINAILDAKAPSCDNVHVAKSVCRKMLDDHFNLLSEIVRECSSLLCRFTNLRSRIISHMLSVQIETSFSIVSNSAAALKLPNVFSFEEISMAIRSGAGLGGIHDIWPLCWTWASTWLFEHPAVWPSSEDRRILDSWMEQSASTLSQAIWRFYCFSPFDELATNGIRPALWRAPLSGASYFRERIQAESVLAGLTSRASLWRRLRGLSRGSRIDLLQIVPEALLLEVVVWCSESQWAMGFDQIFSCYLFSFFELTPSTPLLKDRFVKAFSLLADHLGRTTPAMGLRAWIRSASD